MKKYKELLSNFSILTLGSLGSKLLSFFLIPLYTAILTSKEYGTFDIMNTTITLLIPLLTLNISEAGLRFMLDYKDNKKNVNEVISICIKYNFYSIFIVTFFLFINSIFGFIIILKEWLFLFFLMYVSSLFYQTFQNIIRGFDKLKVIAISGLINSLLFLTLNILFLLKLKFGLIGYFLAYIISSLISSFYLICNIKKFKFQIKTDKKIQDDMIKFSKPLMLNSIGWWINNVSDRYIVILMCGAAANGIYSISYKIPSLLAIIQGIFNQAWTISAIKNFKDNNSNYVKNIYEIYNLIMIFSCSFLIILNKFLAMILYKGEFYSAWKYAPILIISMVFGALSGLIGGIFSAMKETKIMGSTTFYGAIINIILNIILVYYFGIIGAAIATVISFFIVWFIRYIVINKKIKLNINLLKDIFSYFVLIMQAVIMISISKNLLLYFIELFLLILLLIINYKSIKKLIVFFSRKGSLI